MAVIPNAIEMPKELSPKEVAGEFRLLYLGRLHSIKGIENLLWALKGLNGCLQKPWSLKIAGFGEQRYVSDVKNLINKLELSSFVKMGGGVFGEAKQALFEHTDVLVLPSYTENFGMVVAEALAHGVPVIASKGTPWERVEEIGCGLWTANDPESLKPAIIRISQMPLQAMGARGRDWMAKEFSWEDRAREMTELYGALI